MRVRFLEADDVRIRFEAACNRLGEGEARRAFSMALNKEGRKSFTQLRRSLALQSSIPRGAINAATALAHDEEQWSRDGHAGLRGFNAVHVAVIHEPLMQPRVESPRRDERRVILGFAQQIPEGHVARRADFHDRIETTERQPARTDVAHLRVTLI